MTDDDGRPSPEDLLPLAMGEERRHTEGRLTVYLGYAAGVGKTYTMLADARALRSEGADIVIGYVETHGRPETDALAARLETVPPATIEYQALGSGRWTSMEWSPVARTWRWSTSSRTPWRPAAGTRSGTRRSRSCSGPGSRSGRP